MTGEISSNSSSLLSAPPPPPPLPPADRVKNCGQAESNDKNEKTSGSIASENSSSTKPTTVLSEGPAQLATEQKIDTPILVNTSVGISKATALKYSIAILLLCTSSAVAGVCTYFMISAVSSGVAVPVLFAVIASVSALVMLSSAVYLINSHISAINSEKGVDPGRKQSQYSELQKEAESLGHSNTPTSSLPVMSGTPSAPPPPPPPPEKSNDLSTTQRVIRKSSPSDANQKNVQQKQSNTSVDAQSDLLAAIRQPRTLKKIPDEQKKNYLPEDGKQESNVQLRNTGAHQVRKVESQKTDKEPSNSESMQQMNSLAIAIQKQRGKSGFQNEQLDSLDENDHQEDSLFCLEEEQFKPASQEQKKCVQQPDAALSILKDKCMETKFLQPESPINNLSSNSANVPDDEDWDTEPNSISDINLDKTRQEMRQEKKEKGASPSTTKGSGADQVSNEVQDPSNLPLNERRKIFAAKV